MDDNRITEIIHDAVEAAEERAAERQAYYNKLIEKHEHVLYGNGREGLLSISNRLERTIERYEALINKVVTAVVIMFVTGIIILVVRAGLFG